jgi:hypothetical protein
MCDPASRPDLNRDFNTAQTVLDAATADGTARAMSWYWWCLYCRECRVNPWLRHSTPERQSALLLSFASRTRTEFFWKGWQVGAQMVEKALHHVAQAKMLAGYNNPRRPNGSHDLDLLFTNLLKTFKDANPVIKPQVALPVAAIECAVAAHQRA